MDSMDTLIRALKTFEKMYEEVRIVQPISKTIIALPNDQAVCSNHCFDFWNNGEICKNCISMRALSQNETFVKIEYNKKRLYMVIAAPFEYDGQTHVLELLKDVTETSIIENFESKAVEDIQKEIETINSKLVTDELTEMFNRRFINERLPVDIIRARSFKKDLSIIMADIDFFKKINDTYGHLAGDSVLRQFSFILKDSIRNTTDWAARYGGEEFIIALDGANSDEAFAFAEMLRKKVEATEFTFCENKLKITSSFGIKTLPWEDVTLDMDQLIGIADAKLYEAKRAGRNRCVR